MPLTTFKSHSRQQQGGATIAGPIKKKKKKLPLRGIDLDYFHAPMLLEFLDNMMQVVRKLEDYPLLQATTP